MKHTIKINIDPSGGLFLFNAVSKNAHAVLNLLTNDPVFRGQTIAQTKTEKWYPMDNVMPPLCPRDDIYEERLSVGEYEYSNFLRKHISDMQVTGSPDYWYMLLKQKGQEIVSVSGTNGSSRGFSEMLFKFSEAINEEKALELTLALMQLLKIEEE